MNNDLIQELESLRNWAGDNLPASQGLTMVVKLEALIAQLKQLPSTDTLEQ